MAIQPFVSAQQAQLSIGILMLNAGRGSGVVAQGHAGDLVSFGHDVTMMYPGMEPGDYVEGVENIPLDLGGKPVPVHEGLPRAGAHQKPVSAMGYDEAMEYLPYYTRPLEEVAPKLNLIIGHHANLSAIAVHRVAQKFGIPYALFVHGTGIEPRHDYAPGEHYDDRVWAQIETAIRDAASLMVTTDYVRTKLVQGLVKGLPDDRFFVLPIGVDLATYAPGNTGNAAAKYGIDKPYVICPGAISELKGTVNVVEASKYYADLAPTYFIGGGEQGYVAGLVEQLGDRGRFLGYVSNTVKAQLINGAMLLTGAPNKEEHFGIVYPEGMAAGKPVVAYKGGGVGSIVTPEVGVLTDRSPQVLGEAIRRMLLDEPRRLRMGQAARRRAVTAFDANRLAHNLNSWVLRVHEENARRAWARSSMVVLKGMDDAASG